MEIEKIKATIEAILFATGKPVTKNELVLALEITEQEIEQIIENMQEEYKERGISFNVLALGAVQTEMLEEAFPGYEAPIKPKEMADYIFNFSLTGNKYYNGKVLQVSSTTP